MGSVDNGGQILSYDYKEQGTSAKFNRLHYKVVPRGIYAGGAFSKVDDTNITIAPLITTFEDIVNSVTIRLETTTPATLVVSSVNLYVIGRFTWLNTENNFMDFLAVPFSSITASDLVLGKLTYTSSTLSTTFDYSRKSWSPYYYYNGLKETTSVDVYNPYFKTYATSPYSTSVIVSPGKAIVGGKIVTLSTATTSPAFTFPVSSNGRTDILTLNSVGSLSVITGADTSGAPTPIIPVNVLPIAKISFPALATEIQGNYIEYLNPTFTPVLIDSNTTSEADNADTVDSYHAGNSAGQVPVSNGTVNTTLNADLLDGFHAGNASGQVPVSNSTVNVNLNADMLDGVHAGNASGQIPVSNNTRNIDLVADKVFHVNGLRVAGNADTNIPLNNSILNMNLNADLLDGLHSANTSGAIPINNTTLNVDLNADLLDGYHAGNATGLIPVSNGTVNVNLNADLLDGFHAGNGNGNVARNNGTLNTNLNADLLDSLHASYANTNGTIPARQDIGGGRIGIRGYSENTINAEYASSAGRAFPYRSDGNPLNFIWSSPGGQPQYYWGITDGGNSYVYTPAAMSVGYATSAGSCSGNATTSTRASGLTLITHQVPNGSGSAGSLNLGAGWIIIGVELYNNALPLWYSLNNSTWGQCNIPFVVTQNMYFRSKATTGTTPLYAVYY
jgi:hypothetical protein